jgi:hypothetical protein
VLQLMVALLLWFLGIEYRISYECINIFKTMDAKHTCITSKWTEVGLQLLMSKVPELPKRPPLLSRVEGSYL